jgi:hypothetical protein
MSSQRYCPLYAASCSAPHASHGLPARSAQRAAAQCIPHPFPTTPRQLLQQWSYLDVEGLADLLRSLACRTAIAAQKVSGIGWSSHDPLCLGVDVLNRAANAAGRWRPQVILQARSCKPDPASPTVAHAAELCCLLLPHTLQPCTTLIRSKTLAVLLLLHLLSLCAPSSCRETLAVDVHITARTTGCLLPALLAVPNCCCRACAPFIMMGTCRC